MRIELSVLCRPLPPWLLKSDEIASDIYNSIKAFCNDNSLAIRSLDGRNMTTLNGVLEEFGKSLNFPGYYGCNSAALEECLNDLSWLSASGYVILITNSSLILANETPAELTWLMTLLERVCQEWSRPVSLGEEWDRPAVPFHVVFLDESNGKAAFPPQIASLPKYGKARYESP